MKEATATRIAAEVSFVLTIVSGAFSCGSELWAMLALVGGILVTGLIAVNLKYGILRCLISLLPAASILLTHNVVLAVAMGLAALYFVIVMTSGNFDVEYLTIKFIFEVMAVLCLVVLFTFIAKAVSTNQQTDRGMLVFAFLFFSIGIITMRMLRLDAALSRGNRWMNAAFVLAPALVGMAACAGLFLLLKKFGPILTYPLLLLVSWLYSIFTHNVQHEKKPPLVIDQKPFKTPPQIDNAGNYKPNDDLMQEAEQTFNIPSLMDANVRWDLIIAAVAILIALIIILLYVHLHRRKQTKEAEYETTTAAAEKGRRKRSRQPRGNAEKVRQIYREYLHYLRMKGVEIGSEDTSLEILDDSKDFFSTDAAEVLRRIYIRARYANDEQITAEDVTIAEECLRMLKEDQKQ